MNDRSDSDALAAEVNAARAPTVRSDGGRRWIYPDRQGGSKAQLRRRIAIVLIGIYLIVPFSTWRGFPVFRIDLSQRIAFIAGQPFYINEASLIVFILLISALSLFFFTAVFGRVWCGYACPQTVFIDWIIRPIEELLEGPWQRRMINDAKPKTGALRARKALKHISYFAIAGIIAHALLAYFIPLEELLGWMTSSPSEHPVGFALVFGVTGVLYYDFAWFREQFCSFICPYARFQSVLMDRKSPGVFYDANRGEPRGKRNVAGDCIDCQLCVRVCPTGIDIRNGPQLECIQCSRCVDACNRVMSSLKRPRDLISITSEAVLAGEKSSRIWSLRVRIYAVSLALVLGVFIIRILNREILDVVLTKQGAIYGTLPDGRITNVFSALMVNRSAEWKSLTLQVVDIPSAEIICGVCTKPLEGHEERRATIIVAIPSETANSLETITIKIAETGKKRSLPWGHKFKEKLK